MQLNSAGTSEPTGPHSSQAHRPAPQRRFLLVTSGIQELTLPGLGVTRLRETGCPDRWGEGSWNIWKRRGCKYQARDRWCVCFLELCLLALPHLPPSCLLPLTKEIIPLREPKVNLSSQSLNSLLRTLLKTTILFFMGFTLKP